ncbi:MAG: FHA domain-containing protein [Acidobacteriota bacterium]|nr:FHA domain-containing protein [Acidobacteriota bacterium]
MKSLEQLDRWIGIVVKRWSHKVSGGAPTPEILEIRRDILNQVKDQIQAKGNGEYVFPCNEIDIRIGNPDAGKRDLAEAAFAEDRSMEKDIRDLLSEAGCRVRADFTINIEITADENAQPFRIAFHRTTTARKAEPSRPVARLSVVRGQSDTPQIEIHADRVNLGRLREVVDERGSLRRRNDIAFAESETTVSREHAYIRYDPASGKFRLYDYMSQRETAIFRDGRRIEAPRASTRGVQLQSGDEIHLGDARVRFEIFEIAPLG